MNFFVRSLKNLGAVLLNATSLHVFLCYVEISEVDIVSYVYFYFYYLCFRSVIQSFSVVA